MRSFSRPRAWWIVFSSVAALGSSRPALARDEAPAPATPAPAEAPPDAAPRAAPHSNLQLGPVEELPPSGYPEPKIRGLEHGSLWLDMQGWQWPYVPRTGIALSGYAWVDTSYANNLPGENAGQGPVQSDVGSKFYLQQARVLVRTTPTWSNGEYFVQGQAELVASKLAATSTGILWSADDAWVRVGKWNAWDLQAGRFQMWEVYHFGMGMDLFTFERIGAAAAGGPNDSLIPDAYGETSVAPIFLRQDNVGEAAVHVYPVDWLRFELGGQYGPATNGDNVVGVRPAGILDFGWLKLKGEYQLRDDTGSQNGSKLETLQQSGGGAVQIVLDPTVEFGGNFEYAKQDVRRTEGVIDAGGTLHQYTVGGFANARVVPRLENLLVGVGAHYTFREDTNFDPNAGRNDTADHLQMFGAIQYVLFGQFYVKAVGAYALATVKPTPLVAPQIYKNEVTSLRLRLQYFF